MMTWLDAKLFYCDNVGAPRLSRPRSQLRRIFLRRQGSSRAVVAEKVETGSLVASVAEEYASFGRDLGQLWRRAPLFNRSFLLCLRCRGHVGLGVRLWVRLHPQQSKQRKFRVKIEHDRIRLAQEFGMAGCYDFAETKASTFF